MTPEERAKKVRDEWCESVTKKPGTTSHEWELRIAAAIREAVAEEREACAKIAEEWSRGEPEFDDIGQSHVAALIRARGYQTWTPEGWKPSTQAEIQSYLYWHVKDDAQADHMAHIIGQMIKNSEGQPTWQYSTNGLRAYEPVQNLRDDAQPNIVIEDDGEA